MSRPIYCRPEDRVNESKALNRLVSRLNADVGAGKCAPASWSHRPAGQLHAYDAVLQRNGFDYALVEVKTRSGSPGQHAEWHIAKHKIDTCRAESTRLGLRFMLIFSWGGETFIANMDKVPANLPTHVSGRYDRGDAADVEPMYLIPASFFKRI